MSKKHDKLIKDYILNSSSFTWIIDIADHTIWGFKNAPYKNFKRAINKVEKIVDEMLNDDLIEIIDGHIYKK